MVNAKTKLGMTMSCQFICTSFHKVSSYLIESLRHEKCILGMAVNGINIKLSLNIFLTAFYVYSFLLHAFYDCNLRAYLMSANYEPVANTAKDVYEQGKPLYIQIEYSEEAAFASLPNELYCTSMKSLSWPKRMRRKGTIQA